MDGIPPALLQNLDIGGILALLVVAFIKGWVYVGSWVDKLIADKDAQIAYWKEAHKAAETAAAKLTANADLTVQLLRSIESLAQRKGGDD